MAHLPAACVVFKRLNSTMGIKQSRYILSELKHLVVIETESTTLTFQVEGAFVFLDVFKSKA